MNAHHCYCLNPFQAERRGEYGQPFLNSAPPCVSPKLCKRWNIQIIWPTAVFFFWAADLTSNMWLMAPPAKRSGAVSGSAQEPHRTWRRWRWEEPGWVCQLDSTGLLWDTSTFQTHGEIWYLKNLQLLLLFSPVWHGHVSAASPPSGLWEPWWI